MSSIRLRRLVAVLGLAGWIALLPAAASAASEPFQLFPERGLLAQAWDFVAGMLGLDGGVPTETVAPTPDLTNGDQGATVDPNGRT
ncbi:MAG TPA: hypothetical protein VEG34_04580 [Thermoanaerobaculia bacterium]|nr:hypothetical protein [Thermoanaerobaculia bacterium]